MRKTVGKKCVESLCWSCKNCYNGCSWARDFELVEGCNYIKKILYNGKTREKEERIIIIECPQYKNDKEE